MFLTSAESCAPRRYRTAAELAQRYIASCAETDGRDVDTPIVTVIPGSEPPMFTCHFIGWDASKAGKTFVDPYQAKLAALKAAAPEKDAPVPTLPKLRKTPVKGPELNGGGAVNGSNDGDASAAAPPTPLRPGVPSVASGAAAEIITAAGSKVIAYDELKGMDASTGVDMTQKESYLSDAEFRSVFEMTKDEFGKMALWKKQAAKKKVGLF